MDKDQEKRVLDNLNIVRKMHLNAEAYSKEAILSAQILDTLRSINDFLEKLDQRIESKDIKKTLSKGLVNR